MDYLATYDSTTVYEIGVWDAFLSVSAAKGVLKQLLSRTLTAVPTECDHMIDNKFGKAKLEKDDSQVFVIYKIKKAFAWLIEDHLQGIEDRKTHEKFMTEIKSDEKRFKSEGSDISWELNPFCSEGKSAMANCCSVTLQDRKLSPFKVNTNFSHHCCLKGKTWASLTSLYFQAQISTKCDQRRDAEAIDYRKRYWNGRLILMGLTDSLIAQLVLFMGFLSIYMISVVGNIGLILIIQKDSQLHRHMYFFLCGLSFVDLSYSTAITPKTLENVLTSRKKIPFIGCFAQKYFFISLAGTECFLHSSMAYDCYVAICNPLFYSSVMSTRVCMWLMVGSHGVAFTNSLIVLLFIARLLFFNSNVIQHFFCDASPILFLSCADTHNTEMMIFILAVSTLAKSLIMITVPYMAIISAILKIISTVKREKAFSTCASHLTGVIIFYGTLIFTYLKPRKSYSLYKDQVASVFYTIVVPMLNTLIYSLRSIEVKNALSRMIHLCPIMMWLKAGQQADITSWRTKGRPSLRRSLLELLLVWSKSRHHQHHQVLPLVPPGQRYKIKPITAHNTFIGYLNFSNKLWTPSGPPCLYAIRKKILYQSTF
ncbi:LOW QUALITY PROTEIN: olfactory receptor 6B3-like [Tachyglossus aculeatus]|uniref:LOW QUALITY PROTEIN: olfactory receptor 6B3-like n=1 Tax=Tachyglossus aculeatus TaxID=9261 RepID=UPI0018F74213|nr:LOW QUALITY PROTEIN: olfactory receptor 6B3-like [Tachyglossus aculeatus]